MSKNIVNRVEKSKLILIDLEDYYLSGDRYEIDLKNWLVEDLFLKEKEFRKKIKTHNWDQYKDAFVAIHCSTKAIIPPWAYMLISSELTKHAKITVLGNLKELEKKIFEDQIEKINLEAFKDKSIVIKGCSNKKVPVSIFYKLSTMLIPIAKSIMYGEACSSVPVYKRSTS